VTIPAQRRLRWRRRRIGRRGLQDEITEWSPDEGTSDDKTTVGKTLNQARGYSEDAYQRLVKLEEKIDKILNAVT
jgi:hypothetical protein